MHIPNIAAYVLFLVLGAIFGAAMSQFIPASPFIKVVALWFGAGVGSAVGISAAGRNIAFFNSVTMAYHMMKHHTPDDESLDD